MENPILLFFIALYLLVTLAIGWWASKRVKSTADFVNAGHNLPTGVAACALFATWFGSETVLGASSEFVEHGVLGIIEDPFGAAVCLFLAGLLIARPLYKRNFLTFSDFYRQRFGKRAEIISAICMVPSYFGWISAQLVAMGILMQTVTGMPLTWGVLICAGLVSVYTFLGGMWAVSLTDFFQTIAIVVGMLLLAAILVGEVGGFQKMVAAAPPDFFNFFPPPEPMPWLHWLAAWMTLGLGSLPQQDVFQRVMAARSEKSSIHACYWSALMYLSVGMLPLVIAFCGKMLYPELLAEDSQQLLPNMVLRHAGLPLQILFFGALISAILSTASGAMLAPATVLGENLVKPLLKNVDDQRLLRIMRWSVAAVAVGTTAMALMRHNIYELVSESSALSLVSLFVPLMAGLYWRRGTDFGAVLAMILGMLAWFVAVFLETEVPAIFFGLAASCVGMFFGSVFQRRGKM